MTAILGEPQEQERSRLLALLCAAAIVTSGSFDEASRTSQAISPAWGRSVAGLRIGVTAYAGEKPDDPVRFRIALENTGITDFVVNLGSMLANGKVMWPTAVRLKLTDGTAHERELHFRDPRYPGIAGRVDDYTVALRAGALYEFVTSADQYWSPATKESELTLAPGPYRVAAWFEGLGAQATNLDTQGISLMNFWKGTVQSELFPFEVRRR